MWTSLKGLFTRYDKTVSFVNTLIDIYATYSEMKSLSLHVLHHGCASWRAKLPITYNNHSRSRCHIVCERALSNEIQTYVQTYLSDSHYGWTMIYNRFLHHLVFWCGCILLRHFLWTHKITQWIANYLVLHNDIPWRCFFCKNSYACCHIWIYLLWVSERWNI